MPSPPRKPLTLSIVLPCYQEAANVERVTRAALSVGGRVADALEVIVVDDGSTDGTAALADALAEAHQEVRAVHLSTNRGYGAALRSGFDVARMDWIFYTDGDGQFDLDELPLLLGALDGKGMATGYRIARSDGWLRWLSGVTWTAITNAAFEQDVRDVNCAFKLFPRALLDRVSLSSEGALIGAELIRGARAVGLEVGEVGVRHLPRVEGKQTGASPRVIAKALAELFLLLRERPAPVDSPQLGAR